MPGRMKLNRRTIRYLNGLPAVRGVHDGRIRYNPEFVDLFAALRREGRGTTEIFRAAGLAPEIIGRKRIEQCAARWTGLITDEPDADARRRLLPYPWDHRPDVDALAGAGDGGLERCVARLERRVERLEHLLCLDVIDADATPSRGAGDA